MIPVTLQERIHEKKTRIASCETVIRLAKEELTELEKEQEQEKELTPFQKHLKDIEWNQLQYDGPFLSHRRDGWNAAMKYIFAGLRKKSFHGNWVYDYIYEAIEK